MNRFSFRVSSVVSFLTAALVSCAAPAPTEGPGDGHLVDGFPSTLSVVNDGPVTMSDVKVLTSDRDSVVIATLAPGQVKGPYGITVMHESPVVILKIQGRMLLLHPVEGFAAFNAPRGAGAYTVKLRLGDHPDQIDLRISPP
ncbi:MAG: hypothetical protein ABIW79_11110 [Gemmatimonas sp.]